ncbi:MAG: NAD(P)/FAD-dependent oxidoreductase [Alphaproteobacteria bacterium]|nr:NAD(P)/FAD-dependent oxidoreductase [Alphaproteobacteria bacterium]
MSFFETDVVIIGAGPVGLFAIFECGMLGLRCHVVDALESVGGQCSALYPEKPIYDIPGFPKVSGADLIHQLEIQASPFHPNYHFDQEVSSFERKEGFFHVQTSKNITIKARSIIIAAGGGAFGPNRPPLDHLSEFEGKSVFYLVKSRENFRNKKITIAGGGDSALDWALSLSEIAEHVNLIHRRDKFRASPESLNQLQQKVEQGLISLVVPYQLKALHGKEGMLDFVEVATLDGDSKMLPTDILLPFFGLAMHLGPLAHWGLDLENNHLKINPVTMNTNVEGVYAIGDIATYPGKLKLILTGFAEAASAAHAIHHWLNPDKIMHFEYSTTKGIHEL